MTTILVVDDESKVLRNVSEILEFEHYDVLLAEDGLHAFALAKEHQPDLIISDLVMPVVDGFSLFLDLRRNPETRKIPFVLITSFQDNSTVAGMLGAGIAACLYKPFSAGELLDAIRLHLGTSHDGA